MRQAVLGVILAVGGLSIAVAAVQGPPAPKVVEVEQVRDNLFVLKGGGGNTGLFITTNGVVVVDTKYPEWGHVILNKIKELTSKPVTMIINTHTHRDHSSGNPDFPVGIEIVTHENTKPNMEKIEDPEFVNKMVPVAGSSQMQLTHNVFKANNGRGLPTKTFKDRLSLGSGNDRIDLYYFGRGHTNGDAWVVFPALRAMQTGDLFARKSFTGIDSKNGGSAVALVDTLAEATKAIKNVDTIIPGHATQMFTMNDLREFADFNRDFAMFVREAKKAGKSVDDIVSSWKLPARYAGYVIPPEGVKRNAQALFSELK